MASLFNLVFSLYYWTAVEFVPRLFVIGFFGSAISTLGIAFLINALAIGPTGSATALTNIQNILLLIT